MFKTNRFKKAKPYAEVAEDPEDEDLLILLKVKVSSIEFLNCLVFFLKPIGTCAKFGSVSDLTVKFYFMILFPRKYSSLLSVYNKNGKY